MKNKITLLMMVGCIVFSRTTIINAMMEGYSVYEEEMIENETEASSSNSSKDGDGSATTLDTTTDTNTTTDNTSDFLTEAAKATSGEKITQTGTLELSGDESGATNNGSSTSATAQKVSQVGIFQLTQLENGLLSNEYGELVNDQGNVILDKNNSPIEAKDIEYENGNLIDENGHIIRDQKGDPIEYSVEIDLTKEESAVEEIQESAKQLDPEDPRTVTEALEKINQILTDKTLTVNQAFTQFFAALGDLFAAGFNAIGEAFNRIPNLITNIEASMENIPEGTEDLSTERINAITDEANDPKNFTGAMKILGLDANQSAFDLTQQSITDALNDPALIKYQTNLLSQATTDGQYLRPYADVASNLLAARDTLTNMISTRTYDTITLPGEGVESKP